VTSVTRGSSRISTAAPEHEHDGIVPAEASQAGLLRCGGAATEVFGPLDLVAQRASRAPGGVSKALKSSKSAN
jgi:hypothetical protein